jgi:hypothetical protein
LEPLLPDERLLRIARTIRLRFPSLPDATTLFTYYQEEEWVKADDGIERPVPPQAVFVIKVPNPRHPGFDKLVMGRRPITSWQALEQERGHSSEIVADPAFRDFAAMVPEAVRWFENTRALN